MSDPRPASETPSVRSMGAAASGAAAFIIVGSYDALSLWGDTAASTAAIGFGWVQLLGLFFAVVVAFVVPPAMCTGASLGLFGRLVTNSKDATPQARLADAAWVCACAFGALLTAVGAGLGGAVSHAFAQARFAAPFVALLALVSLGVSLLVGPAVAQAARALFRRVAPLGLAGPLPLAALVLIVPSVVGLALLAIALGQMDLGAFRLHWVAQVLVALVLTAVFVASRTTRSFFDHRVTFIVVGLTAALGAVAAMTRYADAPDARRLIPLEGHLSRIAVALALAATDGDGDGTSDRFGGGDCDDDDAQVGPTASEVPGNGVDDNCSDGDAVVIAPSPPPSIPAAPSLAGQAAPLGSKRHNVVILLIDTLRPDHLGLHGYGRETSPNLDAFAKTAMVFDSAFAAAPNTPRSMPSLFTGRYPSRIAWVKRFANFASLKDENETVFELAAAVGVETEAQSAHWYWERASGIKAGVKRWDNRGALSISESNTQSVSPELTARVVERINALAKGDAPFLLFAHYFDPHARYMNHPEVKVFGETLMDKYDSEIAFTDHHLAPVFAALNDPHVLESTTVIVCSDHGESFNEHGFHFHGRTVYQDEVAIPLLIRTPGGKVGRAADIVSLVDLLPTIAALQGFAAPNALGQSLRPLLTGQGEFNRDRVIFMEQLPYPMYDVHMAAAVDSSGRKVVRNVTQNTVELYDLNADPQESKNLADSPSAADPAAVSTRRALMQFLESDSGDAGR
ncbi:MAG: hypothetical protein EXR76_00185 [Myxococcales bacterium]|nr:hypothetical protein [Myxococcales bacterium]